MKNTINKNIIYLKLSSERPLPVMVWIFGGGFQLGEASREFYGPDYFMQKDVILVTVAYRLGALGNLIFFKCFLYCISFKFSGFLSFTDPDLQIPGNAGIKDQVLALKWIKENIENFNGDPNNITIFGESAGAASVHLLMLTPQTKGLFHKAILQSGSALCNWVNTPPRDWGYKLACIIGYKGDNNEKEIYKFLSQQNGRNIPCRDTILLNKQERFQNFLFAFTPVVEPYDSEHCITTKPFKDLMANAWSNEIPVIIGGTSFENLFHYATISKNHYLINDLTDCVNLLPDDVIPKHTPEELQLMAAELRQAYYGNKTPSVKETLFEHLDLLSYRTFWHAILRTVKGRSAYANNSVSYCYVFDFDSSFLNHFRILNCGKSIRGVSHGDDISYLFHNVASGKLQLTSGEFKCVQRIVGIWYNFALNSNPNGPETEPVYWHPVDNDSDLQKPIKVLNISDEIEFKDIPMHRKLQLWNSFYTKETLY